MTDIRVSLGKQKALVTRPFREKLHPKKIQIMLAKKLFEGLILTCKEKNRRWQGCQLKTCKLYNLCTNKWLKISTELTKPTTEADLFSA
ncbi:hypothetical protein G9A89_022357 [Geosiphon pyriformis]|nr:hypothetical protein G9A89_022357 [Geosiphon pyriformis]